eukprot:CAMPEP_0201283654 /NCGR_PEP_ID=MMETSP1317-20130820/36256_1 /ASSEMBLY_ACC=CAM_ASM_000770 /TAXON_ID=187299 /ORGANISM="Undescribed Undescribed, Strain Undescribed" /LENGTH=42 /DNA_ID= /DNA_START= /DNA_END= /DNA_ORIENTATION=
MAEFHGASGQLRGTPGSGEKCFASRTTALKFSMREVQNCIGN